MIAVDTSALMAIVLGEPGANACIEVLEAETDVLVSAGTWLKPSSLPAAGVSAK